MIHRNKVLELNNQYELLIIENNKIRNQGKFEKKQSEAPVTSEERLAKYKMEEQQRVDTQRKAELEALIVEIEKQIFITDIHEIAGKTKGEFWHQGSVQTLSEGDTFGDWYIKKLSFKWSTTNSFFNSKWRINTTYLVYLYRIIDFTCCSISH